MSNQKTYRADNRCKRCGNFERYKSNRGCVVCVKRAAMKFAAAAKKRDPMEGLL